MVARTVVGVGVGDGVVALDCLHEALATGGVGPGAVLDCERCERAELPEGLDVVRTAGPFDADGLPAGLRRDHRVAAATWGRLRVIEGTVRFSMATDPPIDRVLTVGDTQPIPPGVPHHLSVDGAMVVAIDFLVRPPAGR